MVTRRRGGKKLRELRPKESMTILSNYIKDENEILGFKNHRKHNLKQNTFRFTIDLMSLEFLISLMEDERVKNVYFNPSVPPPGGTVDSISLRYKVYVEYEMVI
tara:strand:+ start:114 stop:425 length:312 start_codon:yes stop_codon:yes gene_type:complete